jgi:hypothetical protein
MFDLRSAVENWRRELLQGEAIAIADINEMETHLHEEIESLAGHGLSEEEAFLVAVRRLGDAGDLTCEFAKVNGAFVWRRRLFWMLMGVMLFMVAHAVAGVAAEGVTLASIFAGWRGERVGMLESVFSTAVLVGTFYGMYRIFGLGRGAGRTAGARRRSSTAVLIGAAAVVFVCTAATRLLPVVQFRLLSAKDVGTITLGASYGEILWAAVAPFALAIILILMARAKRCRIA